MRNTNIVRRADGEATTDSVLQTIYEYAEEFGGRMPTVREIADRVYLAPSVVDYHLSFLLADGRLRRSGIGGSRNYEIPDAAFLLPERAREVERSMKNGINALAAAEARMAEMEAQLAAQATRLAAAEALMNGELSDLRLSNASLEESVVEMLEMLTDVVATVARYGYTPGGPTPLSAWLAAALGGIAAMRREPESRRSRPN